MSDFGSHIKIDRYRRSHIKIPKGGLGSPISVHSRGSFQNDIGNTIQTYLINDNVPQDAAIQCHDVDFTQEMWMKVEELGSGGTQFFGVGNAGWRWRMINDYQNYELIIWDGLNFTSQNVTVNLGQWHHHAWTYENATHEAKLYLDGNLIDTASVGDVTHGASGHAFNCLDHSHNDDLNHGDTLIGNACEMRIWHKIKTEQEINQQMNIQLDPDSYPELVGYWQPTIQDAIENEEERDNPGYSELEDLSGNGYPLLMKDTTTERDDHPFID